MIKIRTIAFAGIAMIASMGAAAASQSSQVPASQFFAAYQQTPAHMTAMYDHSGSIGRLNYGADAAHPEGPANFSD